MAVTLWCRRETTTGKAFYASWDEEDAATSTYLFGESSDTGGSLGWTGYHALGTANTRVALMQYISPPCQNTRTLSSATITFAPWGYENAANMNAYPTICAYVVNSSLVLQRMLTGSAFNDGGTEWATVAPAERQVTAVSGSTVNAGERIVVEFGSLITTTRTGPIGMAFTYSGSTATWISLPSPFAAGDFVEAETASGFLVPNKVW